MLNDKYLFVKDLHLIYDSIHHMTKKQLIGNKSKMHFTYKHFE